MPLPEAIENQPTLLDGLGMYMDAFQTLSSCRTFGQGFIGPIPWTAIDRYAERYNIKDEESYLLLETYIQKMDDVYTKHITDKMVKKLK